VGAASAVAPLAAVTFGCAVAALAASTCGCAVAETPHASDPGPPGDAGASDLPETGVPSTALPMPSREAGESADAPGASPCSALPLCDDFESALPGGPPSSLLWSIATPDCSGSGALAIDDTVAHSGTHSVRVDGGGGYCDHVFFANANVVPSLGSEVYLRLFLRLEAPLGAGHVTFLAMKDTADQNHDLRMGGQNAVLMYNRQSDDATLPVLSPTGVGESLALVEQQWTCVEFQVDETAGTIDTWVDGREVAGLVENGTPVPDVSTQWLSRDGGWKPQLADLRLGWESYAGQSMTLWFDDVALADHRIGCGT
jgi:polysaccharide lyase-like protein